MSRGGVGRAAASWFEVEWIVAGGPELPAAGTGPQAACPAAERAMGREAARSAALDPYERYSAVLRVLLALRTVLT